LFAVIGIVFAGAPAWAHDELIGADPATGARVDALPAEITMTFSGVLMDEPGATDVVVTDAAGTDLTSGDPVIDGTRLTQQLSGSAAGEVTVIWRVVSSDGHPSRASTRSPSRATRRGTDGERPSPTDGGDPDMAGPT
jgi:methionine-rich copper-binding protein CopC